MKTGQEYADELIEQYKVLIGGESYPLRCTINDVKNTLKVVDNLPFTYNYQSFYYKKVLQILEDKL